MKETSGDLVVRLGRCRYLGFKNKNWFCGHPMGPTGSIFRCTPECRYYIEIEKFLPRVIREKDDRGFRLS